MSYPNPSRKHAFRLSTPVRLGAAAVAACFISAPVLPNPVNPTVINGAASFNQAGNVLTVTNTNGAIINWQKFSIQAGETTHFAQTSASSSVLNRVLSDPTAIYGTLSSNGRVWLVNPAGIMVGPGGRVDVAGFVASTLNIRNEDFLAGRNVFINDSSAKNVINQGEIRTPAGGSVYLIGSNVSNEGIITTPKGETILAAGATVSLIDSATPGVKVDITGSEGNATNLGTITAEAGRIGIAGVIVRNSGQINASSVVSEGGRVFLKASQDAYVDGNGRIVTTGTKGGSVEVLGNRVAVMDNAEIDASGANGGGRIMVGGDYQGKNPDVQNASISYFGPNASLKANATEVGDGGTVIVWADDTTRAYGNISVRGGASGGDGGFVEVSGHRYLDFHASVDRRAPQGKAGLLLLDPSNIEIGNTDAVYGGTFTGTPPNYFSGATSDLTKISWATINSQLSGGDVAITTTGSGGAGNITVSASPYGGNSLPVTHTAWGNTWTNPYDNIGYTSASKLSLLAENKVNINASFGNAGNGSIVLIAGWDVLSGVIAPDVIPYSAGKNITINGGATVVQAGSGGLTMRAADSINILASASGSAGIDMDTGNLNLFARNSITLQAYELSTYLSGSARIQTNGNQTFILAGQGDTNTLSLLGANGAGANGGQAVIEQFGLAAEQIFGFANNAHLLLTAGSGDGTVPLGQWSGSCYWDACSANSVSIENWGSGGQTFNFGGTSGTLKLSGGNAGTSNYASIGSHAGNQVINGQAAITLKGGNAGGAWDRENGADISLGESNLTGSQIVSARSITILGGGGPTTYGGAGFGSHNGRDQTFTVSGDLAMTGGGSNASDFKATPAYIASEYGGGTKSLYVGGKIILEGGTGTAGGVLIGSLDSSGANSTVNLFAGGDISATANTGGVWLGVKDPYYYSNYVSDITLIAGWNGQFGGLADVGTGPGDILAAGLSVQTAGGAFTAKAYGNIALGDINTDAWSSGSTGGDVFIKASNGTLGVHSISARGQNAWSSSYGGVGGYGGKVELWAKGDLTVGTGGTGGINATGGDGYDTYSWGASGGAGGDGGVITIDSQSGKIQVNGGIVSNGGWGGDGGEGNNSISTRNGGIGGKGGKGGDITLTSGTFITLEAGKTISSVGGHGGWGGDGGEFGSAGTGGAGGGGGIIKLIGGSYISLGANSSIIAKGGDGGEGGRGGYDNFNSPSSGYGGGTGGAGGDGGTIELKAAAGKIELASSAALDASGGMGGTGGEGGSYSSTWPYGNVDYGGTGGMGGAGGGHGSIVLEATAGDIQLGSSTTDSNVRLNAGGGQGGYGGRGGYGNFSRGDGGKGGMGGYGGSIRLATMGSGNIAILAGDVVLNASGGPGGTGGDGYYNGSYGGMGGTGGVGGSIVMQTATAGSITLGANISLDASGGVGGTGGYGDYNSSNNRGAGGAGGTGGYGGYVGLESGTGGISMNKGGTILARGGNGGAGGTTYGYSNLRGIGGNGGNAGNASYGGYGVYLGSAGTINLGSATLLSTTLDAGGGHGGGYAFGGNGGNGGNGGYVYVEGASIVANHVSFLARGGSGGNGDAAAGRDGGNGGNGGYVGLVANTGALSLTGGSIVDVGGGIGGQGADSFYRSAADWYYGTTGGGKGGDGGYGYLYAASGEVKLDSSSILANGGGGGWGGNDLTGLTTGYVFESGYIPVAGKGGDGGIGGNGGRIAIEGGSITMIGNSSVEANGGWGGWGGNGFGSSAVNTVVDGWGVEICGGASGIICNGTQTTDSHGVLMAFHPADGAGPATEGGSGGYGGSVYSFGPPPAIWMNATAGNLTMSSGSTISASPGGGGQGGLGWDSGNVGYYYSTYPSSYIQWISWTGISGDFSDWSKGQGPGTSGTVSLNASGNISLGRVEAWDGTVNVSAGGAIIDNNGSGATNILARNATLSSTYGGTPGSLAISVGTEVSGILTATVYGGASGGIDIANTSWNQQPTSVTLTDNATSGSATFRQVFQSPTATLYGSGISLSAQPGGFVGLSSNRDLTLVSSAYGGAGFFSAGGGGIIGFAANNGTLNINSTLAGGTDSVELSAGTLNISAPVSGVNVTLDGSITTVSALTEATTGDLSSSGDVLIIAAAMKAGKDIQLAATTIDVKSTGSVYGGNNVALVAPLAGGTINLYGGVVAMGMAGTSSTISGIPYKGIAFVAQNVTADGGYLDAQGLTGDISGLVSGNVTLKNGAYFWAGNDIELVLAGSGSTVSLDNSHFLADYATQVPATIFLDFLTRSSGGVTIDGAASTTSSANGSGFFVGSHGTPATTALGGGLVITYANTTTTVDPCVSSPDICKPPLPIDNPVVDVVEGDPCATAPDSAQCKAIKSGEKDKDKEKDGFGDADDGKKDENSSKKKVAQCGV